MAPAAGSAPLLQGRPWRGASMSIHVTLYHRQSESAGPKVQQLDGALCDHIETRCSPPGPTYQ
jgi:hypothetical protein